MFWTATRPAEAVLELVLEHALAEFDNEGMAQLVEVQLQAFQVQRLRYRLDHIVRIRICYLSFLEGKGLEVLVGDNEVGKGLETALGVALALAQVQVLYNVQLLKLLHHLL